MTWISQKLYKEAGPQYQALLDNLNQPVILEQEGEQVAVLMSLAEYETMMAAGQSLSAVFRPGVQQIRSCYKTWLVAL
jgi:PHD/YefM family antitoxin component YafN of YafNO toxin-antitoxin module